MIEVKYLSSPNCESFTIENEILLEDGFNYLKSKTGVYIDPYGTTRLYPEHQQIILDFWNNSNSDEIKFFCKFLTQSIKDKQVLLFVGD